MLYLWWLKLSAWKLSCNLLKPVMLLHHFSQVHCFLIWMNEIAWSWDPCFFRIPIFRLFSLFVQLFQSTPLLKVNYSSIPFLVDGSISLISCPMMLHTLLIWCSEEEGFQHAKLYMQDPTATDLLRLLSSGSETGERKKHIKRHPVTRDSIDGSEIRDSPVEVGSLSHYFQGFSHPRWCRIFFRQQ